MKFIFVRQSAAWLPLLAGMAGLLSACGQYGDLYLPEDAPAEQAQPQQVDKPQDKDKEQPPQDR